MRTMDIDSECTFLGPDMFQDIFPIDPPNPSERDGASNLSDPTRVAGRLDPGSRVQFSTAILHHTAYRSIGTTRATLGPPKRIDLTRRENGVGHIVTVVVGLRRMTDRWSPRT